MNTRNDPASGLGELEGAVMDALWDRGELSTPEVHNLVGASRGLAYTTILTVLQRLHRKGLAARRESGKLHVYAPALSREAFARQRGQDLASTLVQLGEAGVAAFFVEAEKLDPQVVAVLRRQLEQAGEPNR